MKKIVFIMIMVALVFGCTNDESARRVLEGAGYTKIKTTGYNFFACSQDDLFHTGFEAIGPTGKFVKGTVCEGFIFKNSTIRFE